MRKTLRNSIMYLIMLFVCCLSIAFGVACKDNEEQKTPQGTIAFSNDSYVIDYNSRMQLEEPKVAGMLIYELEWTSSNESIITVTQNGQICSYATAGEATITATIKGTEISDSCVVSVVAQGGKIPALILTNVDKNEPLNLYVGSEYTVNAKVLYSNNEIACDLAAYTDNEQVVSVNGLKLTAVSVGKVDVQIKTTVLGVECVEIIEVNVIDRIIPIYSDYELNLTCETDETATISLEKLLVNNVEQSLDGLDIEYSIDQPEIADLSQNGNDVVVTAKRFGQTKISAKYTSGSKEYINYITVNVERNAIEVEGMQDVDLSEAEVKLPESLLGKIDMSAVEEICTENGRQVSFSGDKLLSALSLGEQTWVFNTATKSYQVDICVCTKILKTADDLLNIQTYGGIDPNGSKDYPYSGYFILGNDIDLGNSSTNTLATWQCEAGQSGQAANFSNAGFSGVFDGRGRVIQNGTYQIKGLFGTVSSGALIKNVGFYNASVAGTLFGQNFYGNLENVFAQINLSGNYSAQNNSILGGYRSTGTYKNCVFVINGEIKENYKVIANWQCSDASCQSAYVILDGADTANLGNASRLKEFMVYDKTDLQGKSYAGNSEYFENFTSPVWNLSADYPMYSVISLNANRLLRMGQTSNLSVISNVDTGTVTYGSDSANVTVTADGKVTPVAVGMATVYAMVNGIRYEREIKVVDASVAAPFTAEDGVQYMAGEYAKKYAFEEIEGKRMLAVYTGNGWSYKFGFKNLDEIDSGSVMFSIYIDVQEYVPDPNYSYSGLRLHIFKNGVSDAVWMQKLTGGWNDVVLTAEQFNMIVRKEAEFRLYDNCGNFGTTPIILYFTDVVIPSIPFTNYTTGIAAVSNTTKYGQEDSSYMLKVGNADTLEFGFSDMAPIAPQNATKVTFYIWCMNITYARTRTLTYNGQSYSVVNGGWTEVTLTISEYNDMVSNNEMFKLLDNSWMSAGSYVYISQLQFS